MTSRSVTIVNQLGMHARAAAKFVQVASRFQSRVVVRRQDREMDGRSIIGLLLLAASCGTAVTIVADGPDEQVAVNELSALVAQGFGEDPCSV